MGVVLDTNHFTELIKGSKSGAVLNGRLENSAAEVFLCIVIAEEVVKGWLAEINRRSPGFDQVVPYRQFQNNLAAVGEINILPFDEKAAAVFSGLRSLRLGVGTMDLKIAAICLAHGMTLLTRNRIDFDKVPGLPVENWLD